MTGLTVTPKPGNEFRGLKIRLYPDQETVAQFRILQDDLRVVWNWLVARQDEALDAKYTFAVKSGLVGAKPVRPNYDGMAPDVASAAKEAFHSACRAWYGAASAATKGLKDMRPYRIEEWAAHFGLSQDYQLFNKILSWSRGPHRDVRPNAYMLQALAKDFKTKSTHRKRRRRSIDPMPLRVRSGTCFVLGDFGTRRERPFYNCQVAINGLKIRGRLPGVDASFFEGKRVLEGVSLVEEADGWYAAIKYETAIYVRPAATPGTVIGIDVGLDNHAVFSDGTVVPNQRALDLADEIARRQKYKKPVGRLYQKARRHTMHVIYNAILKPLTHVETIKIEALPENIGRRGSRKTSSMRTIHSLLKQRYGDRVREVRAAFTSQDCSACGHRSKEGWSYDTGPIGTCPCCGTSAHRDFNAARNIAASASYVQTADYRRAGRQLQPRHLPRPAQ